jgi:hypothetical protein
MVLYPQPPFGQESGLGIDTDEGGLIPDLDRPLTT